MGKVKITVLFLLMISWQSGVLGQDIVFLGEGRMEEVRLFWIPAKGWDDNLDGFNVKRKVGENWILLNSTPIVPGTSITKGLDNLGLGDKTNNLVEKRQTMIRSGNLKSIETDDMIDALKNENTVKGLSVALNLDFDVALISGFGLVDREIGDEGFYIYGLFPVYDGQETDKPVSIFEWENRTTPEYKVSMQGALKSASSKRKEVELVWKVDIEEYKKYDVLNGFNIYRKSEGGEYTRLNETPIWVSLKQKSASLYYKDEGVDLEKNYTYAAAPNTIFNTHGTYAEVKVEVQEMPETMNPPVLSAPEKGQNSLLMNWSFSNTQEPFIKGFYVQLADENNVFGNISELLAPNIRSFNFLKAPEPDNKYYHFKVIAVTQDGLELWSNRKIFFNKVITTPSAPQTLSTELVADNGQRSVKLEWQAPAQNAEHVTEYYLYSSSPGDDRVVKEGSLNSIIETSYIFPVYNTRAAQYTFAISATNDQNEESPLSEKVTIMVPSESLPFVNIWPVTKENGVITLNWKYPEDILDLAGFRLFQNGELIADENTLEAGSRQWVSSQLEPGNYNYELIAVSLTDVQSEKSQARKFNIE
ncbi:hypothetical protein GCM10009122_38800 [Fulvivirga kasyanovii]|uniref:Fibronectin type III domain-containing protein n=1 Tax=Fulvivirga kasyanovii TaxID=396812 RepID=A0ABW9RS87_9BACT|nr:fibronectin type III domain-containing protein [Fulvivirga kasyanovii]MTI27037.1 fibronectin type III domain-containing protein [Fulvivirga kasyanovii]